MSCENQPGFTATKEGNLQRRITMRHRLNPQPSLGTVSIKDVEFDCTSRHELVPILMGLQHIYVNCTDVLEMMLKEIETDLCTSPNPGKGCPGMSLWENLVLAAVRHGCNLDYDQLADLASYHTKLREILCISSWDKDKRYKRSTVHGNISRLSSETVRNIDQFIVDCGHALCSGDPLKRVRFDSFVLKKNIHYPTDTNLVVDGVRKVVEIARTLSDQLGISGWRQHDYLKKKAKRILRTITSIAKSRAKDREMRMRASYIELLEHASFVVSKAGQTIRETKTHHKDVVEAIPLYRVELSDLQYFLAGTEYVCDLARRRMLENETIPNTDKVFSHFEPDTELINRGKRPNPIEFGHRVLIGQDNAGFILHSEVMNIGITDEKIAVGAVKNLQARFAGKIKSVTFDKGFWTPDNLEELSEHVPLLVLPKKGKRKAEDELRERAKEFVQTRKWHAGVESAIHGLMVGNGMDVCRDKGAKGYRRYAAMATLGRNLQTLGNILVEKERKQYQKKKLTAPFAVLVG